MLCANRTAYHAVVLVSQTETRTDPMASRASAGAVTPSITPVTTTWLGPGGVRRPWACGRIQMTARGRMLARSILHANSGVNRPPRDRPMPGSADDDGLAFTRQMRSSRQENSWIIHLDESHPSHHD